jgi:uncharacterized DUF497 family protein
MQFEWSDSKAESNLSKHGISFVAAIQVFKDPRRVLLDVTRPGVGEARTKTIGKAGETIMVAVVHTDRAGIVRIISARRANKNEKERYYNQGENSS